MDNLSYDNIICMICLWNGPWFLDKYSVQSCLFEQSLGPIKVLLITEQLAAQGGKKVVKWCNI